MLWDKQTGGSSTTSPRDILRMLSTVFAPACRPPRRALPRAAARGDRDAQRAHLRQRQQRASTRPGFSTRQHVYERAVGHLFATLDELDARLADRRFLFGDAPLETDWRLFTTLLRFDAVYQIHFKCWLRKLIEYEHLWPYARDLYQWPAIADTVSSTRSAADDLPHPSSVNLDRLVACGSVARARMTLSMVVTCRPVFKDG